MSLFLEGVSNKLSVRNTVFDSFGVDNLEDLYHHLHLSCQNRSFWGTNLSFLVHSSPPPSSLPLPSASCITEGVYGDVQRVKILYNKKDSALIQMSDGNQAQLGKLTRCHFCD